MKPHFLFSSLVFSLAVLSSCKPTPRTATDTQEEDQEKKPPAPSTLEKDQVKKSDAQEPQKASPAPAPPSQAEQLQEDPTRALVAVKASQQGYILLRPWDKQNVQSMRAMGIYLGNGLVLTSGQVAKDATYLELSLPDASRTIPARVVRYDPDLQLAILSNQHLKDADFFKSRLALPVGDPLKPGEEAEYWGTIAGKDPLRVPLTSKGSVTSGVMPRLLLQSPQSIPSSESFGYPIVSQGQLRALSSGFHKEKQSLIAINAELIKRFVQRDDSTPVGIPVIGISLTNMADPVLSDYLKVPKGKTGAYVSTVNAQGAAAKAGIKKNDVVLAIDDFEIDNQCTVQHPLYGRIDARTLISSLRPLGEKLRFTISRQGKEMILPVQLDRVAKERALIAESEVGEKPRYIIHGGLVFQPLSKQYLEALEQAAKGNLPVEFLSLDAKLDELQEAGYQELCILSFIIPSPVNNGYNPVSFSLVEKVNGKRVHNFAEMASLLDEATTDGMTSISLNKPPYTIYLDQAEAAASNTAIRRNIIPQLRQMEKGAAVGSAAVR